MEDVKEISYRKPRPEDLTRIAEIYNHAVRSTAATFDTEEKAPEYFRVFIIGADSDSDSDSSSSSAGGGDSSGLNRMLVAEVSGEVVAYAGTYAFSQRQAYAQLAEMMIYVHPEWQRQRVGSALLREVHRQEGGFLEGLHTVLVLINKENVHLHRVFERLGYGYKGEMTDVALKFGRRHSLVIYQRAVLS